MGTKGQEDGQNGPVKGTCPRRAEGHRRESSMCKGPEAPVVSQEPAEVRMAAMRGAEKEHLTGGAGHAAVGRCVKVPAFALSAVRDGSCGF